MRDHDLLKPAVEPTIAVLRAIRPDQLELPTPCADFTVRGLLEHMHEWAPILGAAGGGSAPDSSPVAGSSAAASSVAGSSAAGSSVTGSSAADSSSVAEELVWLAGVWSQPAAWEGTTTMGGGPLPAELVGGMALGEIVVHGWDLGRATGQFPEWDDEVVAFLFREVERTAELGREVKAYGPEVPVAATAPLLDRALGLTGRDPRWTPPLA